MNTKAEQFLTWSANEIWDPAEENLFRASLDTSELADMAREADLRRNRGSQPVFVVDLLSYRVHKPGSRSVPGYV